MDADRIVEKELLGGGGTRPVGPKGLRNFNPGNIRVTADAWKGKTGDDGEFVIFESAFYGIRALSNLLNTYHDKYGLCTVRSIISRWAPPKENNTEAYIKSVCQATGFGADDWLRVNDESVNAELVKAIIKHECGSQPFTDAEIIAAVRA